MTIAYDLSSRTTRRVTLAQPESAERHSVRASVRQAVRFESNAPPFTAFLPFPCAVEVHSQQLPQKSMPLQAPGIPLPWTRPRSRGRERR